MVLLRGDEKMLVLRFFVWLVSLLSFGFVSLGTVTYSLVDEGENFDQSITFEEFLIENDNGYFINDVYLENMIENGDFSFDTDNNGVADNFYCGVGNNCEIVNGAQKATRVSGYEAYFLTNLKIDFNSGHKYYFKSDFSTDVGSAHVRQIFCGNQSVYYSTTVNPTSFIFTRTITDSANIYFEVYDDVSGIYVIVDNVILIDLTETFGVGNEPSLNDFELFYIDDVDYFDEMTVNGYYVDVDDLDFQALYEEFFDEEFVDFEQSDLDVERNVEYTFTSEEITINDVVLMIAFGLFWVLIIRMIGGIIYVRFNS